MFTGIIECTGEITKISQNGTNTDYWVKSDITDELKIDQSLAHNGVCLTVVEIHGDEYKVTAIDETLQKTALSQWQKGDYLNLERAMQMNARLDGHIVQGHVDQVGICTGREDKDGSWIFSFSYDKSLGNVTIEKGSICINGVSLTVVDSKENSFSVAIIPYTYEHTSFKELQIKNDVNLEFDVIGKYVKRLIS